MHIDEDTYDAREEGITIDITVNNEPVDPSAHTLDDGDAIVVTVTTDATT